MAMAIHNLVTKVIYLLALGRAALQLVLHASCSEGSWCHHSAQKIQGHSGSIVVGGAYPRAQGAGW